MPHFFFNIYQYFELIRMQNIGNFHRTVQDLVKMHLCAIEARVGSRKAAALAYCYHGLLHNNFRLSKGLCFTL